MLFYFALSVWTLSLTTTAISLPTEPRPAGLYRRQDIDYRLVESTPDPVIAPNNYTDYDQQAAINAVIADISSDPLPQKRSVAPSDVNITPTGYASIVVPANATINAPLNCNTADTFMGSKLFNSGPFDESLCAAACTAQTAYNLKHPPSSGSPKTCQFYSTYVLLKDGASQGQYCSLYTQAWDGSYATNVGQWRGTSHYTIQQSAAGVNTTNSGEVSCPSDVPYMRSSGVAFCSAYLSYIPPTSTVVAIITPATSVITSVDTEYTTETDYITSTSTDVTSTTITTTFFQKRGLATPASAISWSPSRLSKACAAVATGTTTIFTTQTATTPLTTFLTTVYPTTTLEVQNTVTASSVSTVVDTFTPSATSLGVNLVTNPGFDTAFAGDWKGPANRCNNVAYRVQSNNAIDGTYYGESYYYASNVCPAVLQQTLTGLSTTNRYTLSFYLWPRTIDAGSVCSFNTTLGGLLIESFVPTTWIHSPAWVKHTIPGIVPNETMQDLTFSFGCSQGGAAYIDYDAVRFQQESYT